MEIFWKKNAKKNQVFHSNKWKIFDILVCMTQTNVWNKWGYCMWMKNKFQNSTSFVQITALDRMPELDGNHAKCNVPYSDRLLLLHFSIRCCFIFQLIGQGFYSFSLACFLIPPDGMTVSFVLIFWRDIRVSYGSIKLSCTPTTNLTFWSIKCVYIYFVLNCWQTLQQGTK